MSKEQKKIEEVRIFEIKAGKHILCGPPAIWDMEATVDVYFVDGTSEIQYLQTIDLGEAGWQVTTKSVNDLADGSSIDPYLVASWSEDEKKEAKKSPYGQAIATLDSIFKKIAVI